MTEENQPPKRAAPILEIRYSSKLLREQHRNAVRLAVFGVATSLAGIAYGVWALLHHQQVDRGFTSSQNRFPWRFSRPA
jgi:hypothetical protein